MAKKKENENDLGNLDYMEMLAGGGNSKKSVFTKNKLIDYSYPTGISVIDYAYAYEMNVFDENKCFVKKRTILGVQAGSFNVVTGRTQSFKTTISIQMAANIAYANNGNIIHYDTEQRLIAQRVKTLTKLPLDWFDGEYPRYSFRTGAIGFDTLQNDIAELYENKMAYRNMLTKDTGEVDDKNQPIKLMPPTVIIIDSLQNVIEKEYNPDGKDSDGLGDLRSKTQGARSAYTIRGFITDVLPMLKEANIIVLCIAHKTSNMNLNPFGGVKKQFQYGNHDERISGGSAVEFNASAVINLTGNTKEDSRYNETSDGFTGNTVLFEPTKSSTNESGNDKSGLGFDIVIDKKKNGVDNIRTLILFLNDRGRLKGNKAGYRVIDKSGEPISERFSWKNVYEDFQNDVTIGRMFMSVAKEELLTLVAPAPADVHGTIKVFSLDEYLEAS